MICNEIFLNVVTGLFDLDPEGWTDLFVGYTDRAVGAFRWDKERAMLVAVTMRLKLEAQVWRREGGREGEREGVWR